MIQQLKALNFNLLDYVSITGIIDIAIVAFVLYRLMLLIRGTRAVQLLQGLAVLVAASVASSIFNLYTLQWLLRQTMTALVVALPIVFQPELRRALEKIGGGRFLHQLVHIGEVELVNLIDEVTRAVKALSSQKTGALIVLERISGLKDYIDTGIKIEGRVSAELLVSIFISHSPLHDGAVIIRGNQIVAASCVLPLSETRNIGKELGTRHRAGIGITEDTDALTIIVSEETGRISLAVDGVLAGGLDSKTLAERLKGALQSKIQSGPGSILFRQRR